MNDRMTESIPDATGGARMWWRVSALALLCAGPASVAQAQAPKVELGGKEAVIPLQIRALRAVLPVTVNGQGPYDFYLDPGAQGLGVDQSLAQTLKLPAVARAGVKSSSSKGIAATEIVAIDRLQFGSATLSNGQAVVFPRGTFGGAGQPVGMLSPTLFPGYLVTLDYPNKQFRLRVGKLPAADGKEIFAYLDRGAHPALKIEVAGIGTDAQLDTNSDGGLTLPRSFAKRVPLTAPPAEAGRVQTARGEVSYAQATVKGTLRIGRFTLENPSVRFTDAVKRGNIGQDILQRYALTIDIRQRRFQLQQPDTRPDP